MLYFIDNPWQLRAYNHFSIQLQRCNTLMLSSGCHPPFWVLIQPVTTSSLRFGTVLISIEQYEQSCHTECLHFFPQYYGKVSIYWFLQDCSPSYMGLQLVINLITGSIISDTQFFIWIWAENPDMGDHWATLHWWCKLFIIWVLVDYNQKYQLYNWKLKIRQLMLNIG